MKYPIKTFSANMHGRDFVIGDLHGCLSIFENLLRNLNFDKNVDRMFSVGDLIDRGPESIKCLSLIEEPWFHAVLANHEKMMLDFLNNDPEGFCWMRNGGAWVRDVISSVSDTQMTNKNNLSPDANKLFMLQQYVKELPFLISINLRNGKTVHIVHAELPIKKLDGSNITDMDLMDPKIVLDLSEIQTLDGSHLLWSRNIFHDFYKKDLTKQEIINLAKTSEIKTPFNDKLSHVISGHTPLKRPITFVNQTNIDTNVFDAHKKDLLPLIYTEEILGLGLTCLELNTWKFYTVRQHSFCEINPIVITESDFG